MAPREVWHTEPPKRPKKGVSVGPQRRLAYRTPQNSKAVPPCSFPSHSPNRELMQTYVGVRGTACPGLQPLTMQLARCLEIPCLQSHQVSSGSERPGTHVSPQDTYGSGEMLRRPSKSFSLPCDGSRAAVVHPSQPCFGLLGRSDVMSI